MSPLKFFHISREGQAIRFLLIASFLWGSSFVGSKICINAGMLQFEIVFYRFIIGTVLLGCLFHKHLHGISKATWIAGVTMGAITSALYALEMFGITYTDTSKAAFLTSTNIVMMPFLCALFFRNKLKIHSVFSAVTAMAGVCLISMTGGFRLAPGDGLLLLASFGYAMNSIAIEKLGKDSSRIQITLIQFLVVTAFSGLMTAVQGRGGVCTPQSVGVILFLAVGPTAICFLLKNYSIQFVGAVRCTLILSTESVFCAIMSVIVLHDCITPRMFFGIVLIFSGILIEEIWPLASARLHRNT